MKPDTKVPNPWLVLGLAALGQFFLVQQSLAWTLVPGLLLFAAAGVFWVKGLGDQKEKSFSLSPRTETALFFGIVLIGLFFRTFRLDHYPPGLFNDVARQGYGALRILNEGWGPFQEADKYMGGSLASGFYEFALWFRFFSPTFPHLLWGSVFFSLLAFPLLYLFFRRLAGAPVALAALFLFAVMRWTVTYARDGHPAGDLPFFLFGTLACWLWAVDTGKRKAFLGFVLFAAGGCYSYEAFVALFPALVLFALYEYRRDPARLRKDLGFRLAGLGLFAILSFPAWRLHWIRGGFGAVYDGMKLPPLSGVSDLAGWAERFLHNFLMYNRRGDGWFFHNIPYHRMLDDGMGVLWILGLALALAGWRQRAFFYALIGWLFLSLPAVLSPLPAHASRAFGCAGFTAFFAASALGALAQRLGGKLPDLKLKRFTLPGPALGAVLGLTLIAGLNFHDYFGIQAQDLGDWRDQGWASTLAGERIAQAPEPIYVASRFYQSYALEFLDYAKADGIHLLDPAQLPSPGAEGCLFVLDTGKNGVLDLLREAYPQGQVERAMGDTPWPLVYFYKVPPGQEQAANLGHHGLWGSYYRSLEPSGVPTARRLDPVINFTFRNDFAVTDFPPLCVVWTGELLAPMSGNYGFLAVVTDHARLKIDGRVVFDGRPPEGEVRLSKGPHRIELFFQKGMYQVREEGQATALSLAWKKPGADKFEVVPATALRPGPGR